jgi:uncharacterized protein RhaS with RHS repeats
VLGQFTQRDPLGYSAGDENLYRYVTNDVVGQSDPSGMLEYDKVEDLERDMLASDAVDERTKRAITWFQDNQVNRFTYGSFLRFF